VLLVEDDDAIRTSIARHLREHGYRVYEASSAEAATAFVAGTPLQCLILADLMMQPKPDILVEAVRRGHRFATLPIILTRHGDDLPPAKAPADLGDILKMVAENCLREL